MAATKPKATAQPEPLTTASPELSATNLEDLLADELLEAIDWQKVKSLILQKATAKFWAWIGSAAPATDYALNEIEASAIAISGEVTND